MSLLPRPYNPSVATSITSWIKDEFHLRQKHEKVETSVHAPALYLSYSNNDTD